MLSVGLYMLNEKTSFNSIWRTSTLLCRSLLNLIRTGNYLNQDSQGYSFTFSEPFVHFEFSVVNLVVMAIARILKNRKERLRFWS